MLVYSLIFIFTIDTFLTGSIQTQMSESISSDITNNSLAETENAETVFEQCCENKELFDVVSRRCIEVKNGTYNSNVNEEKKFSLGR